MFLHKKGRIALVISLFVFAAPVLPVCADELDDFLQQQQELSQKQNTVQSQLNTLTNGAEKMEKTIDTLKSQISQAEKDLTAKENAYKLAQKNVAVVQQDVEKKTEELEQRQVTLQKRVRAIYENGQVNYLEVIFNSTSISDFISRVEYLGCLVENDQNILGGIRGQQEELKDKKAELTVKLAETEKLKSEAENAKTYLSDRKGKQETALAMNKKQQDDLITQIEKLEADSQALGAKIRQLQKDNPGVKGSISTWPTPGYWYITSPFGYRTHPITGQNKLHTGCDIGAPASAKIVSAGTGEVIFAGWYGAYGNAVIINHGNGLSSLYGHMSSIAIANGAAVSPGQTIGYVGSTGWSTGPHLHFEIRQNGNPVNPLGYFQ
ncbi:Peptidase M23 [Syntrophobotulus glycolicus DSM 8271]|uniref:Peptidase M23 n=1 Tax=Syntrophobotulus glycolicus (strain DSM 8271 / FlGlyR) TaxID=645991 RepID=F0T284_SYNGF|nr:M23 family metallopeptidase [Syntrophobotulus glycolicus]ADY57512.1 Peptidase M23 [Syntrophobotulus glycolicus DSM 8271]